MRYIIASIIIPWLAATAGYGQKIDLSWDKNSESDLGGYRIYFSTDSLSLNSLADVGWGETDPEDETRVKERVNWNWESNIRYFVGVTAYDQAGNESGMSVIIGFDFIDRASPDIVENLVVIRTDKDGNVRTYRLVEQE